MSTMSTTALLIIDVQQALCTGEYAAHEAQALIARINGLAARCRAAGQPVILIQHESADPQGLLAPGSPGWQLAQGLHTEASDLRLRKRSPDSFHQTELQVLLQARGVQTLVICGLQSQFCVDTTTRRALALGYPVQLVADGHSTTDSGALSATQIREHHNLTLSQITSFGPRVRAVPAAAVELTGTQAG